MGDEVAPLIVGVCLASDSDPTLSHTLSTITFPPSLLSHPLMELRPLIASTFPPSLYGRPFLFLTNHGWEIPPALETEARVEQVFQSHTHSISIRLSYSKPRIGLVAEGNPLVSLGFVFCDLDILLTQLHQEIAEQLPSLHRDLVATGYSLLDSNGWPIGPDQEAMFSLTEAIVNKKLHLRLHSQSNEIREALPSSVRAITLPPSSLPISTIPSNPTPTLIPIIEESADMADTSLLENPPTDTYTSAKAPTPGTTPYEILLSYVHKESANEAVALRLALLKTGYRVFLDVECIQSGTDWQDILNDAVSNCTVFVPLITEQYGQTLWTNREVKLADVLGKVILPVNLLQGWPPQCLAIQFATTQYIPWPQDQEWNEDTVARVAKDIMERYKVEVDERRGGGRVRGVIMAEGADDEEVEEMEVGTAKKQSSLSREDTQILEEEVEEREKVAGTPLLLPPGQSQRRSTIKSYASALPASLSVQYRNSIQGSRVGKPLVVISCHTAQQELAREICQDMEGRGYETWRSCDLLHLPAENASPIFQARANEAGVVIFIFSKEFTENSFCEKQVYYCEQRKAIIPVIYEPIQLPHWVSMLIGTSPFITCQSSNYRQYLLSRVDDALNPEKREVSLKSMLRDKAEIAHLCAEVTNKLPSGRRLVYISGGTKFYSPHGEQICHILGSLLAKDLNVTLVTGGFFGVGETVGRSFHEERSGCGQPPGVYHLVAVRDDQDRSSHTRQNKDGTFSALPYGHTIFAGSSVRQRQMITPHMVKFCILVEGGPGAAFEAQQFFWNGNYVIPVRATGGAAGGLFNVPQAIFQRPPTIDESDWSVLGNKEATPTQVASSLVHIIKTLIYEEMRAGQWSPRSKKRKSPTMERRATYTFTHKRMASSPAEEAMQRTLSDS